MREGVGLRLRLDEQAAARVRHGQEVARPGLLFLWLGPFALPKEARQPRLNLRLRRFGQFLLLHPVRQFHQRAALGLDGVPLVQKGAAGAILQHQLSHLGHPFALGLVRLPEAQQQLHQFVVHIDAAFGQGSALVVVDQHQRRAEKRVARQLVHLLLGADIGDQIGRLLVALAGMRLQHAQEIGHQFIATLRRQRLHGANHRSRQVSFHLLVAALAARPGRSDCRAARTA